MARFTVIRKSDGETVFSGRVTDAGSFRDELLSIRGADACDLGAYFVGGKEVTFDAALDAANAAIAAAFAKKSETHKRVTYYDGVSGSLACNTRRSVWVRK